MYTSIFSCLLQLIYGIFIGYQISVNALPSTICYGITILIGYILYVLSLKKLPVDVTGLIETGTLFIYLFMDWYLGIIKINMWFIVIFIVFLSSIILFILDTFKNKDSIKKDIKLSGIIFLLMSMIFYSIGPYLIRIASSNGANEITINMSYYLFAIPYFIIMYLKNKEKDIGSKKTDKLTILKIICLIVAFLSVIAIYLY